MRFFEEAMQFRIPHNVMEGLLKGFIFGSLILCFYDTFSPFPQTAREMYLHSRGIIQGYLFFAGFGAAIGFLNQMNLLIPNDFRNNLIR